MLTSATLWRLFSGLRELTEIRNHYMSDAEVAAYAEKLANSVPEYLQAGKELDVEESDWKRFRASQTS